MNISLLFANAKDRCAQIFLPRYGITFGFEKEENLAKIKQFIKDIKSGDFRETSKNYAHPKEQAKYYSDIYRPLKGKEIELLFKDENKHIYHIKDYTLNKKDFYIQFLDLFDTDILNYAIKLGYTINE